MSFSVSGSKSKYLRVAFLGFTLWYAREKSILSLTWLRSKLGVGKPFQLGASLLVSGLLGGPDWPPPLQKKATGGQRTRHSRPAKKAAAALQAAKKAAATTFPQGAVRGSVSHPHGSHVGPRAIGC